MIPCVILAGARTKGSLQDAGVQEWEALLPVGGEPMVVRVSRALLGSGRVDRVTVVGPPELEGLFDDHRVQLVPCGDTMMENAEKGIKAEAGADHVLVATADTPLLSAEAVADFIDRCGDMRRDLYYTITDERVVTSKYPQVQRTYVRLREGRFTGGNMMLVRPGIFDKCRDFGEKVTANRKKPLNLARLIGFGFLAKYATGGLTLADAERRVTQLIGITGRVIETPYPEIAVDVDKLSDYQLVTSILGE